MTCKTADKYQPDCYEEMKHNVARLVPGCVITGSFLYEDERCISLIQKFRTVDGNDLYLRMCLGGHIPCRCKVLEISEQEFIKYKLLEHKPKNVPEDIPKYKLKDHLLDDDPYYTVDYVSDDEE